MTSYLIIIACVWGILAVGGLAFALAAAFVSSRRMPLVDDAQHAALAAAGRVSVAEVGEPSFGAKVLPLPSKAA